MTHFLPDPRKHVQHPSIYSWSATPTSSCSKRHHAHQVGGLKIIRDWSPTVCDLFHVQRTPRISLFSNYEQHINEVNPEVQTTANERKDDCYFDQSEGSEIVCDWSRQDSSKGCISGLTFVMCYAAQSAFQ